MTNLLGILTRETASLKEQYVALMAEWASAEYERIEKVANAPYPKYVDYVKPAEPRPANFKGFWTGQDYEGQKRYNKALNARHTANNIVEQGCEAFLVKMRNAALAHYEDSVRKLAARIEKKGLNVANLVVKTAHVGVNIETTLTDGEKTVRAFTIIASGPVQKPHYRYLIK
jgi:truncated hemoglobin YjbI